MEMDDLKIEATARACHEANRAYCIAIGDTSHPSFCGTGTVGRVAERLERKFWGIDVNPPTHKC